MKIKDISYFFFALYLICFPISGSTSPPLSLNYLPGKQDNYRLINPTYKNKTINIKKTIEISEKLIWIQPDSAMALLNDAENKSLELNYFSGISHIQIIKGLIALGNGNFEESIHFYNKAYLFALRSPERENLLSILFINIGATYFYQSDYETSAKYYYAILQFLLTNNLDHENLIMAYNNLADVLLHMKQFDQADYYLLNGELLAKKKNNTYLLTYIYANKGGLYLGLKQYENSYKYLNLALNYSRENNNSEAEQAILNGIGELMLAMGNPREAIKYLEQSLSISTPSYPYYSVITPYYNLGQALYQERKLKEAEKILLKGLSIADSTNIIEGKLNALNTLALIYEKSNKIKEALKYNNQYISLQESILNKEKLYAVNHLEIKYRTAQKDAELAQKQLEITFKNGKIKQKNIWIIGSLTFSIILTLLFMTVYKNKQNKQKALSLEAMILGEEKERTRIAQELHDGIGGMLAAIKMHYSSIHSNLKFASMEMFRLLEETSDEVRKTAHNLMPINVEKFNIEELLTHYIQTINASNNTLKIDIQILSNLPLLQPAHKLAVYRMVQESVQNILKHSKASKATIQLSHKAKYLYVLIEDNGKGFNPKTMKIGLGITTLKARASVLSGHISIDSQIKRGTTINFNFPVNA